MPPVPAAAVDEVPVRDLGARGSRSDVAGPDHVMLTPAAAAVLAAVPAWWRGRAESFGLAGEWLDVERAIDTPVPDGVLDGDPTDLITADTSGEALGAAYVTALRSQVRARHGRHYTPDDLSAHLWAMARRGLGRPARATILKGLVRDPACGAGALLIPAVREHVMASVRTEPAVALAGLPNAVEGIDTDPAAVWLANVVLAAEALPLIAAVPEYRRRQIPAVARVGDGLAPSERPASVVVMNPPYGRVRLGPDERQRWSHLLYGHANLYGLFMGAALDDLDEGGVLAAVVPTSFTSGLYFSRLRQVISEAAPLREAAFVAAREGIFSDVLQETCLALFTTRRARRSTVYSINGHVTEVAQVASPRGSAPWLLPRRADDAPAAAAAAVMPLRLADVGYRCSTGPLVWNRRADDLHPDNAEGRLPVVWAADIDGGKLHRDPARDRLRFLDVRDGDDDVLVLDEPAVLVQRTTAPEQTRRLVAAELTPKALREWGGRVVVENHVNVLRPTVRRPLLSRRVLTAVLRSLTIDRVIRSLSGSVAVSAYELGAVPLPEEETIRAWNQLDGEALEAAVAAAYRPTGGLTVPDLPLRDEVLSRLLLIFPRAAFDPVLANPLAASAVAAMLYVGAVVPDDGDPGEGATWARPSLCLWMNDYAYARQTPQDRAAWRDAALGANARSRVDALHAEWGIPTDPWYRDNSRETLRDETFAAWLGHGALRERPGLATTSGRPRWALTESFATLFNPALDGDELTAAVEAWRATHLSPGDLLRISTAHDREHHAHAVEVTLPDGQQRSLEPGDASLILKGVIEQWAPARLVDPVVLTISEPGDKVFLADAARLRDLGLTIDPSQVLPDAVIVDIGATPATFWMVEAVASDGPVTEQRREQLLAWAGDQRIPPESCAFLSAFVSRNDGASRRRLKDLAVGTFAWYADEPTRELAWYELD